VLGNFMNGTAFNGGAFGIRIASINKASPLFITSRIRVLNESK
jgi:hypothetical protein